jgi:hypothetical protein
MIVANSYFIYPQCYINLSEEKILTWRKLTYTNLTRQYKFNKEQLEALPNSKVFSLNEIKDNITDRIFYFKQSGRLLHAESVFIMIDSCTLGKHKLTSIIIKITQKYNLYNKNIILMVSHINMTENNYKVIKKDKYPCINFNKLQFNLDLLNGKIEFKIPNIVIMNTDISLDNKVLIEEEINYLHHNSTWVGAIRNEINDISQVKILKKILNMFPNNKGYFITHDNKLLNSLFYNKDNDGQLEYFTF